MKVKTRNKIRKELNRVDWKTMVNTVLAVFMLICIMFVLVILIFELLVQLHLGQI